VHGSGGGKARPLGIPVVEDKLLQLAVARILEAIYEQDFLRCSYGYRPGVGALDAVDKLTVKLQFGQYEYVVEADIKGFFEHIDPRWMMRMLEERIDDRAFMRLIGKWLKAGVLDTDGKVLHPVTGTPQGGVVSPVLANVYLHYALDMWFHRVVKRGCCGEACLIRYADDYVCAFEKREDAERFIRSRVIPFSRRGSGKSSFEFLGFEFRWGKDRGGKDHLERRTSRKKLRDSLRCFTEWCKESRHRRLKVLFERLNAKLRGHYNYYGVCGNYASLAEFFGRAMRILKKWLDRRSQRRSYNCRKWLSDIVTSSHVVASPDILIIAQGDRRITGIVVAAGFSLISLRASKPLITGIMTSIRMRSGTAETASSTASLPFIAGIISNISLSTHW